MTVPRLLYFFVRCYWRLARPRILGARILLTRGENVLLVRLNYAEGWYLPGGGVDRGESFKQAALRELREECGLALREARLFGLYYSEHGGKRDHIALFTAESDADAHEPAPASREIKEARYFPLRDLPANATEATRRRVREYLGERPLSDLW